MMLQVTNPYSLEPVGEVALREWRSADRWLDTALRLHRDAEGRPPAYQRIATLEKAAAIMRERAEALAYTIADEDGKPLIDARIEVERAIDGVGLAAKEVANLHGREIPMDLTAAGAGRMAFTTREPIGPVVAVSAFNHPLNLIVHQVAPAVAVGCPVIVQAGRRHAAVGAGVHRDPARSRIVRGTLRVVPLRHPDRGEVGDRSAGRR